MAAVVFPNHVGPFLLRDCGHFVPWEAPHALVSATIAFCGDVWQRSDEARNGLTRAVRDWLRPVRDAARTTSVKGVAFE